MTNGEKFKEIFSVTQVDDCDLNVYAWLPNHDAIEIPLEWWNAEYKEPKAGHWEPMWYDGYADGCPVWEAWDCSECGYEHNGLEDTLTNYCPNCGCRMVEPQESEKVYGIDN